MTAAKMAKNDDSTVEFSFKGKVRDFLILASLLTAGGNLIWCWQHGAEIKELRQKIEPPVSVTKVFEQQKQTEKRKTENGDTRFDLGR